MTQGPQRIFTRPDAWSGGSYELAVDLGVSDDARLGQALAALWSHADLEGCYPDHAREPSDQLRATPAELDGLDACLRGVARLGTLAPVACSSYLVPEEGGATWMYLGLPLGSLGTILTVGAFPFDDGRDPSWRLVVDAWLRGIAERVHAAVGIRRGLVGWVDGTDVAGTSVPDERWVGYLVPTGTELAWYAANQGAPMRVGG
jgi:hypothetical protein